MFSDDEDGPPGPRRALRKLHTRLRGLGFAVTFDHDKLERYFESVIDITVAGHELSIEQRSGADFVRIERRAQCPDQTWPVW